MSEQIIRLTAAAAMLGVHRQTVYRMVWKGMLPRPIKIGMRASGFRLSDLQYFLDAREKASRGEVTR